MIKAFDETLEKLFKQEFGDPLRFELSYAVPDREFKAVSNNKNTLNCYLYDISEDRERRNTEPMLTRHSDGTVSKQRAPARIKLTYCITAWSPITMTEAVDPVLDEHKLLGQVLSVLLKHPVLPDDVPVPSLKGQQPSISTAVALPNDVKGKSDFWNAIGGQLRPSLDFSVTLSLDYQDAIMGSLVTTQRIAIAPDAASPSQYSRIGGFVLGESGQPVDNAWVLVEGTNQAVITDETGRFVLSGLQEDAYTLRVRAMGYEEAHRPIRLPSSDYNVQLRPL